MNVGQLRKLLLGLPEDLEVVSDCSEGCGYGRVTTVNTKISQHISNKMLVVLSCRSEDDEDET